MLSTKIFKFFWAIWWMLFGLAVGVHWGFEGGYLALFALISLILADFALMGLTMLRAKLGGHY